MKLTRTQRDALESVAWGAKHFGSLVSGGAVRLRDLRSLVTLGLVKSNGLVALCDADGWTIEPERYREGFSLTEAGQRKVVALERLDRLRLRRWVAEAGPEPVEEIHYG